MLFTASVAGCRNKYAANDPSNTASPSPDTTGAAAMPTAIGPSSHTHAPFSGGTANRFRHIFIDTFAAAV
jgi:hypothetical protein